MEESHVILPSGDILITDEDGATTLYPRHKVEAYVNSAEEVYQNPHDNEKIIIERDQKE